MDRAEVHFSEEHNPRISAKEVCEVTLEGHGHHVRCKVAAADGFAAIDAAVDKLEHQLHKLKTKVVGRRHGGRRNGRTAGDLDADGVLATLVDERDGSDEDVDGTPRIVKTKKHAL